MTSPNLLALRDYLESVRYKNFQWHTFDCFIFSNQAWTAMYGHGWADDWAGKYKTDLGMYMKKKELQEAFGFDTLEAALDSRLNRVEGVPPRGALVLEDTLIARRSTGKAFGISIGNKAAFVGKKGLEFLPMKNTSVGWTE